MISRARHRGYQGLIPGLGRRAATAALTLAGALLLGFVAARPAQAQTYRVLYRFAGGTDGVNPFGGLVRDSAGNLYGTTGSGGAFGLGTVFKVEETGQETVLYSFAGTPDGAGPFAKLIRDAAGNLYGTTGSGGASNLGTVFKLNANGAETVLYSFTRDPDGSYPYGALVRDAAGDLYGTNSNGGARGKGGTLFELATTGTEKVLHSFGAIKDGAYPLAGLVRDAAGNFYGTTELGGVPLCGAGREGCGTVFKLATTGAETILYSFTGGTDGGYPAGSLVLDAAGNLYGTTIEGGVGRDPRCQTGCGTVFKVDSTGTETVLHTFVGYPTDGSFPYDALVRDSVGNFYGTTANGGDGSCQTDGIHGCGTVFKVDAAGTETLLHNFAGGMAGTGPEGGLVIDAAGNLYGTTVEGGDLEGCEGGCGLVFELTP